MMYIGEFLMCEVISKHSQKYSRTLCCVIFALSLFWGIHINASEHATPEEEKFADVVSVKVTGNPDSYRFSIGIKSPDTGCEQYADWWEVLSEDGKLLYRRILLHSHVDEQPFVRSGGPVDIEPDTKVWIRAHMNTTGYGGKVFKGSVQDGFKETESDADFAKDVEKEPPQPEGCAF
jgi:hypothetical protein